MAWVKCLNCQGNGRIYKETKPGIWKWQTCSACNGTGKVNASTV